MRWHFIAAVNTAGQNVTAILLGKLMRWGVKKINKSQTMFRVTVTVRVRATVT